MDTCNCSITHALSLASSLAFLSFGAVSSLHCLGMCAPMSHLIYGMPNKQANEHDAVAQRTLPLCFYHGGRILSYAGFGAVLAWFGGRLNGYFQWPVVTWLIIIVMAAYLFGLRLKLPASSQPLQRLLAGWLPRLSRSQRGALIGLLSPLLPCGVLYVALAAASAAPNVVMAATWMALFAFGTIPLLALGQLGLQYASCRLPQRFAWVVKKSMALATIVFLIYMQII